MKALEAFRGWMVLQVDNPELNEEKIQITRVEGTYRTYTAFVSVEDTDGSINVEMYLISFNRAMSYDITPLGTIQREVFKPAWPDLRQVDEEAKDRIHTFCYGRDSSMNVEPTIRYVDSVVVERVIHSFYAAVYRQMGRLQLDTFRIRSDRPGVSFVRSDVYDIGRTDVESEDQS